jgi:hypothetical protein
VPTFESSALAGGTSVAKRLPDIPQSHLRRIDAFFTKSVTAIMRPEILTLKDCPDADEYRRTIPE